MKNKNTAQQQSLVPTYIPSFLPTYLPTRVRIFVPTSCSCDSCRSCRYPPPEVSPPLSGVCVRLVPSSLLFCSFVFFVFCFLNSNSGAASFSSSSSSFPASASFYFVCFNTESPPREAPQVVPPALCNCGCFPEP